MPEMPQSKSEKLNVDLYGVVLRNGNTSNALMSLMSGKAMCF